MNGYADSASTDPDAIPSSVSQQLHRAALQRNLRTAAVLALAVSGGLISSAWLAATAGSTFLALGAWRYKQLRRPLQAGQNSSGGVSL